MQRNWIRVRASLLAHLTTHLLAHGGEPSTYLLESLIRLLEAQLPPFFDRIEPKAGNLHIDLTLEALTEALARHPIARERAKRHIGLVESLYEASPWLPHPLSSKLLSMTRVEDLNLILIAPYWGMGWELYCSGVLSMQHLLSLLQNYILKEKGSPLEHPTGMGPPRWLQMIAENRFEEVLSSSLDLTRTCIARLR